MNQWVEVQPLTDEPADVQFWQPEFKVGDRVRVRLSGECPMRSVPGSLADDLGYGLHPPQMDGLEGRVDTGGYAHYEGHPYFVRIEAIDIGDGKLIGRWFYLAACELEPLG